MNHPGEIALLARLAAPTVALVNNAQREHLEFMARSRRSRARTAAYRRARRRRHRRDSRPTTPTPRSGARGRRAAGLTFAVAATPTSPPRRVATRRRAGRCAAHAGRQRRGDASTQPGRHSLHNALAAATCALAAGAPLDAVALGLDRFLRVAGRSQTLALRAERAAR